MAASTVAIARMTPSRISRPDTGLRRPHCARRLAGDAAASAAAEEEVVEHVIVAYVHAGGSRIRRAVLKLARFISRPPCEGCRRRRSRRAHRLACRNAASSGSRRTLRPRRRQLATRPTGISREPPRSRRGAPGRREEDPGGETRWPFEHVGRHEDGSAGAIHEDARCDVVREERPKRAALHTSHPTSQRGCILGTSKPPTSASRAGCRSARPAPLAGRLRRP
jgi:hypothetical protein